MSDVGGAGHHACHALVAERDAALNGLGERLARAAGERDAARREVERLTAEVAYWRALAEQYAVERDAYRRTLADLLEIHPARIVAPAE